MPEQPIAQITQEERDSFYEDFLVYAAETGLNREFEWLNCCVSTKFSDWLQDLIGYYEIVG